MNKALRKAIMTRSRLKNKFNENSSAKNWNSYKTQINFCLKVLHQTKEKYFNNINVTKVPDNKTFRKSVKSLLSNNILLVQRNEIVNNDGKIAAIINSYFTNITKHMNLKEKSQYIQQGVHIDFVTVCNNISMENVIKFVKSVKLQT